MAGTSTMLALGTEAPDFALPDVTTARTVRRSDFDNRKALLVMFICQHCPYVRNVRKALAELGGDYRDRDVGIVAISANDREAYPEDAPTAWPGKLGRPAIPSPTCSTRPRRWPRRTRPPAPRTSSCSTPTASSSTAVSSTRAAPAMVSP